MRPAERGVRRGRSDGAATEVLFQEMVRLQARLDEDDVMDAVLAVWKRLEGGFEPRSLPAYLTASARNAGRRRIARTPTPVELGDVVEDPRPGPEAMAVAWRPASSDDDVCLAAARAVADVVGAGSVERGRVIAALRAALRCELEAREPARYGPAATGAQVNACATAVARRLAKTAAIYDRLTAA